jgi:CDP-diacylglycerol--serine O-phosphatidyltransferase
MSELINGVGQRVRRGAYLLPSAFTIGNMLLGFYAIVRAYRGDFRDAAVMVMVAGVLDALDGRIARLTGTESEFGKEYDSLADVFTFGVAPALLAYFWGLEEHGRLGWLIPLYYLVCTATRLARFNVQTKIVDSRYFVGLPSPAAAGGVVSVIFFAPDDDWKPWAAAALAGSLVVLGTLMVSTFRYRSFKKVNLRQRWSYRVVLPIAAVLLIAAYHPQAFFLAAATAYTVSGPLGWLLARVSRKSHTA